MLNKIFRRGPASGAQNADAPPTRMDESDDIAGWSIWPGSDVAPKAQPVRPASAPASDTAPGYLRTVPGPVVAAPAPAPVSKTPTRQERRDAALAVIDGHYHRVANTIRTMWGHKECSLYINKLVMSGGDGMGQNRVGFSPEAVEAMLALADLHDAEFPSF